ncbi:MAG: hypothetical protein QXN00_01775 [Candidatus Aenigmatarchaeota archaeon]
MVWNSTSNFSDIFGILGFSILISLGIEILFFTLILPGILEPVNKIIESVII